jgi:hypothetical protein
VLQKLTGGHDGREALPLLSLGGHSKQAGDEHHLPQDVPFFDTAHLSFPHHVHPLISLQGSPRALHRKEAQSRFDASFAEAVIWFDDGVEVLDLPQFAGVGNGSFRLQFVVGLWIGGIFIDSDHTRGGGMRRSERFREKALRRLCIACRTQEELERVADGESTAR